jgi:hypothetical protein
MQKRKEKKRDLFHNEKQYNEPNLENEVYTQQNNTIYSFMQVYIYIYYHVKKS